MSTDIPVNMRAQAIKSMAIGSRNGRRGEGTAQWTASAALWSIPIPIPSAANPEEVT